MIDDAFRERLARYMADHADVLDLLAQKRGISTCLGCGQKRNQTLREWENDHDHYRALDFPDCGCDSPAHDYFCPGARWCGEFEWERDTTSREDPRTDPDAAS
jgi:hypothetical protein